MKKIIKRILLPLLVALLAFVTWKLGFSSRQSYEQSIRPPVASSDIPFDEYEWDADSAFTVVRNTGTVLKFPANAFEDSLGRPATGRILLRVREFHQAEVLFRAGIPMSVDGNRNNFLQSAGMIEIRAFSNGKKLELITGKSAEISLAGFRNAEGYRLFHFEDDRRWEVTDTFSSGVNMRKKERLEQLNMLPSDSSKNDLVVELLTNLEEAPYLQKFSELLWKIDASDVNEELNQAMRINWDVVRVKPLKGEEKRYLLNFEKSFDLEGGKKMVRKFQVRATPMKGEEELTEENMSDKLQHQDSLLVLLDQEKERVLRQADLLNSFRISKLGIWNVDKIMKMEELVYKEVGLDFIKKLGSNIYKISLYVLYLDDNSVISFMPGDWKRIPFSLNKRIQLKAVLPGGKIALVWEEEVARKIRQGGDRVDFESVLVEPGK